MKKLFQILLLFLFFRMDAITQEDDSIKKRKSVYDSSNTHKLDFVQFTDFLGFQNDRPNGLLQQELRFKWALNRQMLPLGKERTGLKKHPAHLQFFRALVFPDILLNRIDKSKQEVDYSYPSFLPGTSPKDSITRKLTTMDLLKYTNLQIAARLVLLTLHTEHFRVYLQTGVRMFRNRPFYADTIRNGIDSGRVISDFRSVYSFAPNIEIYSKVLNTKENNIYMDMILGMMWLRLKDAYYSQYDAAVVDEFNRVKTLVPVSSSSFLKRNSAPINYISARLAKDWGEENANTIFFRINYFHQMGKFNQIVRQPPAPQPPVFEQSKFYNHFLQLQLGIKLGLETLFKPKNTEEGNKSEVNNASENQL